MYDVGSLRGDISFQGSKISNFTIRRSDEDIYSHRIFVLQVYYKTKTTLIIAVGFVLNVDPKGST